MPPGHFIVEPFEYRVAKEWICEAGELFGLKESFFYCKPPATQSRGTESQIPPHYPGPLT